MAVNKSPSSWCLCPPARVRRMVFSTAWRRSRSASSRRSSASFFCVFAVPAFLTDHLQIKWGSGLHARGRDRLLAPDLIQRVQERHALERRLPREQLVENGPQGIDVGRRTNFLGPALSLLRGHVTGSAGHARRHG